jgi:pimeloyl-ACP methyl ester carboxylesterase
MKLIQKIAVALIRTRLRILTLISKKKAARFAFELFCTPQFRNRNAVPATFKEAESISFIFSNEPIIGYRWNTGAGRKALIVHGFESSVINFGHFVQPLIDKGYEVLAFDAPAHGRSGGKQINALVYRDFIKHIYRQYGPVQSWIAHSFGGLALCLALAEIPHDMENRVVLVAPATDSTTALNHFFNFLHIRDTEVKRGVEKIINDLTGQPLSWFTIPRTLPGINARILWVHDESDMITPLKDVQIIRDANHPGIHFVITQGLGHRRIYRDAAISTAIIDFL